MPTKTLPTHVKKKVDKIIQRDTKYSNIPNHIPNTLHHPEQGCPNLVLRYGVQLGIIIVEQPNSPR